MVHQLHKPPPHADMLALMGVQLWYPRYPLSNAAPSRCSPAPAAVPSEPLPPAAEPVVPKPPAATPKPVSAPPAPKQTEPTAAPPQQQQTAASQSQDKRLACTVLEWDSVAIFSLRSDANEPNKSEQRLLHDIARALGAGEFVAARPYQAERAGFYLGLLQECCGAGKRVLVLGDGLEGLDEGVVRVASGEQLMQDANAKRQLWLQSCDLRTCSRDFSA